MSTLLITGASGFIGRALAQALSQRHTVVCMSRRGPGAAGVHAKGDFGEIDDLRNLDRHNFDAVVHLGAVTGGCSERDAILVNVEGARCLMRYLIDRGCRKFVMASSIAAVGLQHVKFRPMQVPIPDEHPCLDRDGYGLSKFLMEEVTRYYARQNAAIDVINLRLASIFPDENPGALKKAGPVHEWALGAITMMSLSDAVRAFALATESPHQPGVRVMNAASPKAWVQEPVAKILSGWWGHDVDLSWYKRPGHEWDGVFDVSRIRGELGFVAQRLPDRA